MAFLDTFLSKKQSVLPRAGNIGLLQQYSDDENKVYAYFEAEDDYEFYRYAIQNVYQGYQIVPFDMKGKDNVLDAYNDIDWSKFNKSKVLFFVDKDYDDILLKTIASDQNIFKTKYYSIENYLVTREVFDIILHRFFKMKDDPLRKKVLDDIEESYKRFSDNMLALTSVILVYRSQASPMDLDEVKLNNYFYSTDVQIYPKKYLKESLYIEKMKSADLKPKDKSEFTKKKKLESLFEKTGANRTLCTFDGIIENFRKIEVIGDKKVFIRGKYEMWFLLETFKSIEYIVSRINERISNDNAKVMNESDKKPLLSKQTRLETGNVFDLLSPKITVPDDIRGFLDQNFNTL